MSVETTAAALLCSRRLAMREFGIHDLDALTCMHRDQRLRALLLDDYPLEQRAVSRLFINELSGFYRRHEGLGVWHTSLQRSGDFVGWFSLMPMTTRPDALEIGARLLPAAWGARVAVEGGALLLAHAFKSLQVDAVWGTCHPQNRSARAVLAALGFDRLGVRQYADQLACHYRIRLNAWRATNDIPLGTRMRRAIAATRESCPVQTQPQGCMR